MIKSPIPHKDIADSNLGIRPFVFDIVAPDGVTSLLPDDVKMTLHANPKNISFSYEKKHEISSTLSGWVEYYWGDNPTTISLEATSGAFIRPYTGLSAVTGPVVIPPYQASSRQTTQARGTGDTVTSYGEKPTNIGTSIGGTRRDTITYDKYLDLLALFHNNGSVYDQTGRVIVQGKIKMIFDGGVWFGWFQSFSVTDDATTPYSFNVSLAMQVEREYHGVRTQMPSERS
tara:strand:+ start:554 stop:1243 length:690 start_codon:yes stop_codon:yes gene_type:complete